MRTIFKTCQCFEPLKLTFSLLICLLGIFCASVCCCAQDNFSSKPKNSLVFGIPDTLVNPQDVFGLQDVLTSLKDHLPSYEIKVRPIIAAEGKEVFKQNPPDFVLTPAGFLSTLEETLEKKSHKLATRVNLMTSDPEQSVGGVLAVLKERSDLNSLGDLKGKKALGGLPNSIDGWLSVRKELKDNGFDDGRFFSHLSFSNNAYPDVLSSILNKQVDVGILPACLLENLEQLGLIEKGLIRVVHAKKDSPLKCLHSTALYPDISLWAMEGAAREAVRDVTLALYKSDAADFKWLPNISERRVLDLFYELEEGPFAYLKNFSLTAFYSRYKQYFWFTGLILLILLLNEIRLHVLVKKRTAVLASALLERDKFEARSIKIRKALNAYEKRSVIQQMSGMIAHELSSPLGSIRTYATLLKLKESDHSNQANDLRTKALAAIESEAVKMSGIIDRVRSYAKHNAVKHQNCDLREIISKAIKAIVAERGRGTRSFLEFHPLTDEVLINGNPLEVEILFLNLLRNAFEALDNPSMSSLKKDAKVEISLNFDSELKQWICCISNPAPSMNEEELKKLNEQSYAVSSKASGLGIGLSICRGICDLHGASFKFELKEGRLFAVLKFDATEDSSSVGQPSKTMELTHV